MITLHKVAERHLVRRLRQARAISVQSAQPLENLGHRGGRVLHRLQRAGVVREARGQKWYLDEAAFEAYVHTRRLRIVLLVAVLLLLLVLGMLWFKS